MAERAWVSFQDTGHFGSLDGLRCLSILAVIWQHGPGADRQGLAGSGYMGVGLFFAISGFLITTLLLRENARFGRISLASFYWRRSLRIFPLYFAVLGTYCIMVWATASGTSTARKFYANVPYFLTYTSNWFVGAQGTFAFAWSLAAEEQFYAFWPSALQFLRPARAVWLVVAMLITTVAWNSTAVWAGIRSHPAGVVLGSLPMAIGWGSLAALLLHRRAAFTLLWKFLGLRWASLVCAGSVLAAISVFPANEIAPHFLFAALVACCVIRENGILAPVLRHPCVVHLGRISYGMYLLHGLVGVLLGKAATQLPAALGPHQAGGYFLTVIVTAALATLCFRYFETPFLHMKSRFAPTRNTAAAELASFSTAK